MQCQGRASVPGHTRVRFRFTLHDLTERLQSSLYCAAPCRCCARDTFEHSNEADAAVRVCIAVPRECTDRHDRPSAVMAPLSPFQAGLAFGGPLARRRGRLAPDPVHGRDNASH